MNEPIPKPCKCGNTLVGVTHEFFFGTTIYHVSCLICDKQGKSADTPEGAIEAWNKEGREMNDYEVAPRKRSKCEVKKIPGQTLDLCRDIAAANSLGVSYGVYMGMKHDKEAQDYYEKFGVRMKRRRPK